MDLSPDGCGADGNGSRGGQIHTAYGASIGGGSGDGDFFNITQPFTGGCGGNFRGVSPVLYGLLQKLALRSFNMFTDKGQILYFIRRIVRDGIQEGREAL